MSSLLLNQQIRSKRPNVLLLLKNKGFSFLLVLGILICSILLLTSNKGEKHSFIFPDASDLKTNLDNYLISEPILYEDNALHSEILNNLVISSYVVKSGDSLSGIAKQFGLRIDTVISFNNISNGSALSSGTELKIPNSNGLIYSIRSGDNLDWISRHFNVSLDLIADWNNLETEVILPGQKLFIFDAALSSNELNRVLGKLFIYPAVGRISSKYGPRKDPFTGKDDFHHGLDLANSIGTPIIASMSGTVVMIGNNRGKGKYIILKHSDGFQTLYAHLNRILVSNGDYIVQGQKIGEMGNTGYSTGPHLHFSIYKNGTDVDPLIYLSK